MERRSSRLKAQAQESTQQSVKTDDMAEGSAGVKKRKTYDGKASNPKTEPNSKKARRKDLWNEKKSFADVPVEVLYEIFSQLEPLDLLHLARTTKDLIFLQVALLPQSGTKHPKRFSKLKAVGRRIHDYPNDLFRHLPRITVSIPPKRETGFQHPARRKTVYFKELHEHWQDQYNNITDPDTKAAWVKARSEERTAIATWKMDHEQALFENRKSTILERVEKLGWGLELPMLSKVAREDFFNQDLIVAACEENLTERVLDDLEVFLVGYMAGVRDRRLKAQWEKMLTARLGILSEVHRNCTSHLAVTSIYPTVSELFLYPVVQKIINSETEALFNRSHLAAVELSFPDIALDWQQQTEDKLMDMITKVQNSKINRETVFDVATTVFRCKACRGGLLKHPQVLVHKCATRPPNQWQAQTVDPDRLAVEKTLNQTYWNCRGRIVFTAKTFFLASQIVKMCGFEPLSATAVELDENGPIIECIKCNDERKGRATMTWLDAISHKDLECHAGESSKIMFEHMTVLDKLETLKVKECMAEQLSCKRATHHYNGMQCVYCKAAGNTMDLLQHVQQIHTIVDPGLETVVPHLDEDRPPVVHYLWPPRSRQTGLLLV
ncbi:hypothetical protein B0H34DRAFT_796391 [Crassisporium funariophilum]|nr:hypothetical protein B0H34DRAFT_796391 [Crassisporium funariophilum]